MKEDCNHDVIAWRNEEGTARIWGCYRCKVKFVPVTQLEDEVQDEREACAAIVDANAMACHSPIYRSLLQSNANAIRARGQK